VGTFLANATPTSKQLYEGFTSELRGAGAFDLAPAKRQMGFQRRRIFAVVSAVGKDYIRGYLVIGKEVKSRKFHRHSHPCDLYVWHHFRIDSERFFDEEFTRLVRMAYEFGK
jgi:hypothetical protein